MISVSGLNISLSEAQEFPNILLSVCVCVSSCIHLFESLIVNPWIFTRAMNERQIKVRVLVTVALSQEGETEEGRGGGGEMGRRGGGEEVSKKWRVQSCGSDNHGRYDV